MAPIKEFELTLVWRDENRGFHAKQIDKVEGDDLVELLSQFLLVLASVNRRMKKEMGVAIADDDIPF